MENLMEKLYLASNPIIRALPLSVIEDFQLNQPNYKAGNFKVEVMFSGTTKIKMCHKKII